MYCEQLLIGNSSFYHQDDGEWLKWCNLNHKVLFDEYKRRVRENENTQVFFGDWHHFRNYSDVGYYLGCEFVKALAKKYSLKELANLSLKQIHSEFNKYTV